MRLSPLLLAVLLSAAAPLVPLALWADEAPETRLAEARTLEKAGRFPEALTLYRKLLEAPLPLEAELESREGMARILLSQRLFEEAVEVYRGALARVTDEAAVHPSPALARRGHLIALRLGDYPAAVRFCEPFLPESSVPKDRAWALEQVCICYARQQEWDQVKGVAEKHLPTLPRGETRAGLKILLARALAHEGDREKAEGVYREVAAEYPNSAAAVLAKGRLEALKVTRPCLPAESESPAQLGIRFCALSGEVAQFLGLPPGTPGVLVSEIVPGGPAEEAGLRKGDVVLSVKGVPVSILTARAVVRSIRGGDPADLEVLRAGVERVTIQVRTRPISP